MCVLTREKNPKLYDALFLDEEKEELQKRINRALEYNAHLKRDAKYNLNLGHLRKFDKILKGEKNEKN